MGGEVLVALLVTGVLGDVVEVLAADDDGTVHLGGHDGAGQDTATDGDLAGEGALLVCIEKTSPVNLLFINFASPVAQPILLVKSSSLSSDAHGESVCASRKISGGIRIMEKMEWLVGWKSLGSSSLFRLHTNVLALNGSLGGAEPKTNVLVPSPTTLAGPGRLDLGLAVEEDFW